MARLITKLFLFFYLLQARQKFNLWSIVPLKHNKKQNNKYYSILFLISQIHDPPPPHLSTYIKYWSKADT